jgi:hypothetical protein
MFLDLQVPDSSSFDGSGSFRYQAEKVREALTDVKMYLQNRINKKLIFC